MTTVLTDSWSNLIRRRTKHLQSYRKLARRLHLSTTKLTILLMSLLLLGGSFATYSLQSNLLAARIRSKHSCSWYNVTNGDTLSFIAQQYHITISTLTRANSIANANLIFVGQRLCIPSHWKSRSLASGVQNNGTVSWYDYKALDWSRRSQVHTLLCHAADTHHLPRKLLLAIGWQESGWTQHVIAWDGGIGVMQLMPYTVMGLNAGLNRQLDPYDLGDNVNLGATYLAWLWGEFGGDLPKVISAYNEGGWAVKHRGIFNWNYVNNVMALMHNMH